MSRASRTAGAARQAWRDAPTGPALRRRLVATVAAGAVAALAATIGCRGGSEARHVPPTPAARFARLAADSAPGDAAALAALPPLLAPLFAVDAALAAADAAPDVAPDPTPGAARDARRSAGRAARGLRATCQQLEAPTAPRERRRLLARAPGDTFVLFARADRATGALDRVELLRRQGGAGARGFIWEARTDTLRLIEWPPERRGRAEETVLPRGGPEPRALRGLGRRLLTLPCPERLDATGQPVPNAARAAASSASNARSSAGSAPRSPDTTSAAQSR